MGGHEIGHHILFQTTLLVEPLVLGQELVVYRSGRLSHLLQHRVGNVFRSHLQLAGHMIFHQLFEKRVVLIGQQVVKANAGANEHLFHAGNGPELAQQSQIVAVICNQILTRLGEEALLGGTHALGQLLFAGGLTEVGGGAAHVVDIPLEIRLPYHLLGLCQNGLVASGLDDAPLVEGKSTEAASAETASAGHQAEPHLLNGRHAASGLIGGVVGAHIGQTIHPVHLRLTQRLLGGVLDDVLPGTIGLHQRLSRKGVCVAVLGVEALGILALVLTQLLIGGESHIGHHQVHLGGTVHRTIDKGDILGFQTAVQSVRHLHHRALAHAVHEQVRLAIQQNGALELVRPVVVMGHAPQTGFNAADENGDILVHPADEITVHHRGIVRPLPNHPTRCKGIHLTVLFGHAIVVDHGVHVAAGDQKAQPGPTQNCDGLGVLPIRLGDESHLISCRFQHTADDGMAEGGMVHIGIPNDVDKVTLLPATPLHIRFGNWQKVTHGASSFICASIDSPLLYTKSFYLAMGFSFPILQMAAMQFLPGLNG